MRDALLAVACLGGMAAIIAVHHSHPGGLWAAAVIVLAVAAFMAALRMFWTADIWKGE